MRITARGSVLFGFAFCLLVVSFYLTATTEAKEAFNIAFDSQQQISVQQFYQANQQTTISKLNNQKITTENAATASGENLSEARSFRATAYCLQGRTAVGGGVRRGIVAADPRVLPLGTRIQISAGAYSGTYTVADTGGAVRGRVLDVWVPTCAEAVRFGRKTVSVSVVGGRKSKINS